jgi:hypothetical protein
MERLLFLILGLFLFVSLSDSAHCQKIQEYLQKGIGVIKTCNYAMGEEACGKCYCLETLDGNVLMFHNRKVAGCAILDTAKVGDLNHFVGKKIYYEGTSFFDTMIACPRHFQLLKVQFEQELHQVQLQEGKGIIRSCTYGFGEKICGKCYSLEPVDNSVIIFNGRKIQGRVILDISKVGDLSPFVGKTVFYKGTSEFATNIICPRHFQLFDFDPAGEAGE